MYKDLIDKLGRVQYADMQKAVVGRRMERQSDREAVLKSETHKTKEQVLTTSEIKDERLAKILKPVDDEAARNTILTYEKAFDRLKAMADPNGMGTIAKICNFREKHTAWAVMKKGNNGYFALESVEKGGGFLVVVPSNHEKFTSQRDIISIVNKKFAVFLRGGKVHDDLAVPLLAYSLALLWANPEHSPNKEDIVVTPDMYAQFSLAYNIEQEVANEVFEGRLFMEAKEALQKIGFKSHEEIADFYKGFGREEWKLLIINKAIRGIFGNELANEELSICSGILMNTMVNLLIKEKTHDQNAIWQEYTRYVRRIYGRN